jgi:hypothetical protein
MRRVSGLGKAVPECIHESREALAISAPRNETAVLKHFQERMSYGLFVPDEP